MPTVEDLLAAHNFTRLFIEEFGWDRTNGRHEVEVQLSRTRTHRFVFEQLAQKRGFVVFHCPVDRVTLVDQRLLRTAQKRLAKSFHEHLVVYSTDEPLKQVWQWAIRLPDGRRVRQREHPFFSHAPPAKLVDRMEGLRFTLDEEERVTLIDALDRVRRTLDKKAERRLFVRKPHYARLSDALARRMQEGDTEAFDEFVVMHRPLARHGSRRLHWWFDMDPDDAEQIAMRGLIRAAQRFDPDRGFQFSTYATHWVRQACQRFGPDAALMIRVPMHAFWPCFRFQYDVQRLLATHGPVGGRDGVASLLDEEPKLRAQWPRFERAFGVRSFSDRREPEFREVRRMVAEDDGPRRAAERAEAGALVHAALRRLVDRDRRVIELRYGIGGPEHTLEQVGKILEVTRERVRQIQRRAEKKLAGVFTELGLAPLAPPTPTDEAQPDDTLPADTLPDPEEFEQFPPEESTGKPSEAAAEYTTAAR